MLFSVIIPVYRAEKTLKRCLDSLLPQAEDDTEIILIDDGSPDASGEICDRYTDRFPCVQCIHQENKGVAAARNAGLDRACGEYLLFIDSDDYVASNYFSVIRRELHAGSFDALVFRSASDPALLGADTGANESAVSPGETSVLFARLLKTQYLGSLWSKVFRREIVEENGIRFHPELRISEDLTFVFSYMLHALSIRCIQHRLYFYTIDNTESLSKKCRPYLSQNLLLANHTMKQQLDDPSVLFVGRDLKRIRNALIWNHYRNAYTAIRELNKFENTSHERRKKTVEICRQFATSEWKPKDLSSSILALPIRLRLVKLIHFALGSVS